MIGVILWSDSRNRSAVIWCEDNGDLVYLARNDYVPALDLHIEVGDMVDVEVAVHRNRRVVRSLQVVGRNEAASLVHTLKSMRVENPPVFQSDGANIIPFRRAPALPEDGPVTALSGARGQ